MDLALLTSSDTADCVITDPFTGETTDVVMSLYGSYSDQYSKAIRKAASAKRETEDEVNEASFIFFADLTANFSGIQVDGKDIEFSHANAVMIYKASGDIRKQVKNFIGDNKNFLLKR